MKNFDTNKYKSIAATIVLMLFFGTAYCQTGSIAGSVVDNKTGLGMPGASVIIDGTTQGAISDLDGNYIITKIATGTYKIKINYVGFIAEVVENVHVIDGAETKLNLKLRENINELQGADVVSRRITHTDNAVLADMKKSEQIVSGISAQQISRSQDKTAGDVIKRIPGVTVQDNGFVIIRGLNERYNATLLDGVMAPSLEADKKAFALELIPGTMLDKLLIYKTAAPELPGEFAGGVVKITTKSVGDDDQLNVGFSSSVRINTTFKDFYQAPKGNSDWLGKDDGTRGLPDVFPSSLNNVNNGSELAAIGKKLPNAWSAAKITAMPDQRFNASILRNVKFGKIKAANITAVQYGLTYDSHEAQNLSYDTYNPVKQSSDTVYNYKDNVYSENVRLALVHNWSFIVSPKTTIEFRNFFSQQGSNQTIIREGASYEEQSLVKSYAFRYQQRTVYTGQLHGSHNLNGNRSKLDWTTAYTHTRSSEPDFRRIRTKKDLYATSDSIPYQVIIAPSASTLDAGRFYSDLSENSGTVALNFEHALKDNSSELVPKFRAGFYTESKQRQFNARWISYTQSKIALFDESLVYLPLDQIFSSQNINDSTGFKLEEGTNPSDKYDAYNLLAAGYVGLSWPLTHKINVSGGVRTEYNRQQLESKSYSGKAIKIDNTILSILPSLNLSYNFTEKMLIRAAYGRTVNRPEFRELAPFNYYDFTFNNVLTGNPDLKTPSINNYDVRWEFYPSGNELITLGIFNKEFTNPIEMFYLPGSGTRNFTYDNADKATSSGVELEIKKSFNILFDTSASGRNPFVNKFLSRMGVVFNASLIKSKVTLGDKAVGQNASRPMMGQSPYILNAGLFYTNLESKWSATALYNIIGKRLYAVGTYGIPDIYYLPRNSVDVTVSKGIGKYFEVKFGVSDLLAQDEIYRQDSNENGKIESNDDDILRIKRGATYSLGFNFKF